MTKFLKCIYGIIKLLFILSKHQVFYGLKSYNIPSYINYFLICINSFLSPTSVIKKTKLPLGKRLSHSLIDMGPIYIKLGQTLSTRPDLIGSEIASHLCQLQDKLPPFEFSLAKETLEKQYNKKISDIFIHFDKESVAAASIAQVHKAQLKSGETVAVKILRPSIFLKYEKDIAFLETIAHLVTSLLHKSNKLRLGKLISVFKETMRLELNLKFEASAAARIRDNFAGDSSLKIPKIYWEYTSKNILVTEWIDGVSVYDKKALSKLKIDCKKAASSIVNIFFNQAYRDGFFHADFHPGNILLCHDGTIAMVDFGIVGILPEQDRLAIAEILYAFLNKDYMLVAKIHKKVGYIPQDTNLEYFAQSCRAVAEPIIGLPMKDISFGNLLSQLITLTKEYGMDAQPQLLLLQKTIVMVEGVAASLDEELNMWNLAEPWIKKWGAKNISPEAKILRYFKNFIDKFLY
ncbi:MAG TPA: 2-polyprenylphenol 6-hydroxylase [Candidatus Megaira endosymbiont of Nemacystus decipiens]|nr:2-polyprenylphenol 6-hydroxylase [Candidatus Megaera endosymbiont of Nemacystus decipiens]